MNSIEILASPSKSLSHRVIIAAALCQGESNISNILESEDILYTQKCLQSLGANIQKEKNNYKITPKNIKIDGELFVNESGTTGRLLTGIAAAIPGNWKIDGVQRMRERPMLELIFALEKLGVSVIYQDKIGFMPFIIQSKGLTGGTTQISLEQSSQYLSALLLSTPLANDIVTIEIVGQKAISWPYIGLTLDVMQDFGVESQVEELIDNTWQRCNWRTITNLIPKKFKFIIKPQAYQAQKMAVEGDWSNASYFLAAGALGNIPVKILGLKQNSLQGDHKIVDILRGMGAKIVWENNDIIIFPSPIVGGLFDMGDCPDLVPTIAAVATFAKGKTTLYNIAHLRIKECDRLDVVAKQLQKAGLFIETGNDHITIHPAPIIMPKLYIETYSDHRIAMSMAILELHGTKIEFDKPDCVKKSFPTFWQQWEKIIYNQSDEL